MKSHAVQAIMPGLFHRIHGLIKDKKSDKFLKMMVLLKQI
jgi:hypothetical protein